MAQIYTTLLYAAGIVGGGVALVPNPGPNVWVVRDISGSVTTTGGGAEILINANGNTILYGSWPDQLTDSFHWEGRVVVLPANELEISSFGLSLVGDVVITGYSLTPP